MGELRFRRGVAALAFEVGSLAASVGIVFFFGGENQVLALLVVSLAQASVLEYFFYRRGKYRYSRELFRLVVPWRDFPPPAIIFGYVWFYFVAFSASRWMIGELGASSPLLVVAVFLFCSFAVECVVDNALVSLGLWRYTGGGWRVGGVPVGVLSTVPCLMSLALFLAYYSGVVAEGLGWVAGMGVMAAVGVGGGVGLGLVKGVLPGGEWGQAVLLPSLFLGGVSLFSLLGGL